MNMKKLLLLVVCVAMATMMLAQTQKGYVKTKGRLGNDGQVIPGEPLGEVTIKVKDRNAVMSDKRGDFSFPMPDETYYLESVTKSGYVMIDPELLSKQYSYSKNKLVIALETRENQLEERMDMNEKIMKAQKELIDKLRGEVKQLKAENKITEDEYYKRLQEIVDMQNENRQLVEDLVDHYSKIDYDDMNEFDRLFSSYLLNGDLRKADSLVNSKGDLRQRADEYYQLREANAKAREDLDMRKKKLEKSEAAAIKMRDDLASDYYKKFEINKMQHKNDSAAYWLEERVKLDTTNVEWLLGTGEFISIYIADYNKALYYVQNAINKVDAYKSEQTLYCYNAIGNIYEEAGDYIKSKEYYDMSLELCNILFDKNHDNMALCYSNLGSIYKKMGEYDTAMEYYEKAYTIMQSNYNEPNSIVIKIVNGIGTVYDDKSNYEIAMEYYNQAMKMCQILYKEEHMDVALLYNNIGYIYKKMGEYDKALEYYKEALKIMEGIFGQNHTTVATYYNNIGMVYNELGEYDKSIEYLIVALNIDEVILGEKHLSVATRYNNMGQIYRNMADYNKSLECLNKSLFILKSLFGENHIYSAITMGNIGLTYAAMNKLEEAMVYTDKALSIINSIVGENHQHTGIALANVAYVYKLKGDYDNAIIYYDKALSVLIPILGESHTNLAIVYFNIADIYFEKNEYINALDYYKKSLSIRKSVLGEDNEKTQKTRDKISEVESKLAESNKNKK